MSAKVMDVVKKVIYGIILGIIYYLLYGYLLPTIILGFAHVELEVLTLRLLPYLGLFISLGIVEELLKNHPISIPFRMLTKVMYALILMAILNGGVISTTLSIEPYIMHVRIDITLLLYMIVILSLIYGVIDSLSIVRKVTKS